MVIKAWELLRNDDKGMGIAYKWYESNHIVDDLSRIVRAVLGLKHDSVKSSTTNARQIRSTPADFTVTN